MIIKRHHHKIKKDKAVTFLQSKIKLYTHIIFIYKIKQHIKLLSFLRCNFKIFSSLENKQHKNDSSPRPNEQRLTTMTEEAEEYIESTTNSPVQNMLQVQIMFLYIYIYRYLFYDTNIYTANLTIDTFIYLLNTLHKHTSII